MSLTQFLRDEHRALLPLVEELRATADSVGEVPLDALQKSVDESYEFLTHELIPHAQAEDRVLYPIVKQIQGSPHATATMWRDHLEVERFTLELVTLREHVKAKKLDAKVARELRRVLYGLYAIIKLHLAKEEEIYLPLLECGLTTAEIHHLFESLEEAVHEYRAQPVP
jgi:iron-sulfur cluster repair protein YtfE (RIC family)